MGQFLFSLFRLPFRSSVSAERRYPVYSARNLGILALLSVLISMIGCERENDSVLDQIDPPPVLLFASLSPSVINTDTMNTGPIRTSQDTLTIPFTLLAGLGSSQGHDVSSVTYQVNTAVAEAAVTEGQLLDDGSGADAIKNDQIYSRLVSFRIQRSNVGVFNVSVTARGSNGFASNTIIAPITIVRENHPPELFLLAAPDTVQLQDQSQFLTLRVKATDPDGLSDIVKVYFNSFRPDDMASSGNPFQMFDDGLASHGDQAASDGIFSRVITLPPSTQVGTYKFEFRASDRSDQESNTIIHRVTVRQ